MPLTTTPSHRIMVESDGGEASVMAKDLNLDSLVMCSHGVAKRVIGKREFLVAWLYFWGSGHPKAWEILK